jgi:hypothetical protein
MKRRTFITLLGGAAAAWPLAARAHTLAEALAARIIEQVIDHVLGQPFRLCDRRAYGRAIAALMRNRNLDAAHLLELVWQCALIEELVPVFDPGNAQLAARHQADYARIGRAGALGRFD